MINNIYTKNANINTKIKDIYDTTSSSNMLIKGTVLEKDGRNIRMKTDDNVLLDIVTKNDLTVSQREILTIKKSQIESMTKLSNEQVEEEKEKRDEDVKELEKADVPVTKENLDALKHLKNSNIPATKENILKFVALKSSINNLANIDINLIVNLMNSNTDIRNESVFDLFNMAKSTKSSLSDKFTTILENKVKSPISYDRAREISMDIYGSKMGKDIQDIIISLEQNNVEINKDTIDTIHDVFSKLYNLRDIADEDVAKSLQIDDNVSIDTLYNVKNFISTSYISSSNVSYSQKTEIPTDKQLEAMEDEILNTLKDIGFTSEEISIAKAILKQGKEINKQDILEIKEIRDDLSALQKQLDKDIAAMLIKSDIDISSMDIRQLLNEVNSIIQSMEDIATAVFTEKENEMAISLLDAIKQINSNTILSNISVKSILSLSNTNNDLYNKLFGDGLNNNFVSYENSISLKASIVLNKIESIDFSLIDHRNDNISLNYIADKNTIFKQNFDNEIKLEKLNYQTNYTQSIDIKVEINSHYQYLRANMRATNVIQMLNDNIDPMSTDIRTLSNIVSVQNAKQKEIFDIFNSMEKRDVNFAVSNIISNNQSPTLQNVKKSINIYKNEDNYIDILDKIIEDSDKYEFNDVSRIVKNIQRHLENQKNKTKDELRENIQNIFQELSNLESAINSDKKPEKSILQNHIKNLSENIRQSQKLSQNNDMLQIPFYMNGESNNANVFAKNNKAKKGKINPDDMSVLIDLNTKNLGKMGFFIKVENKKLSIKISGNDDSMKKIKSDVLSLDKNLSSLGYNIDFIDISSPEENAKLSFVEDNNSTSGNIDFFI
jgi:hypothetical protein